MSKFICVCDLKIKDGRVDERIGFGFEQLNGICTLDEDNKNFFSGVVAMVNLFKSVVSELDEDEADDLEYFLSRASEGVLTEIEIGNDYNYDDNYLSVSIDKIESFFEKTDAYLAYVNGDFENENEVINYVLNEDNDSQIFSETDVDNGMIEFDRVADNLWLVKVGF